MERLESASGRKQHGRDWRGLRQLLVALVFGMAAASAWAQGGPPLVTNDPDTPGDGAWEINLAAAGSHAGGAWTLALPDLDVNYGLGERIQLSMHSSVVNVRDRTGGWSSGEGPVELAIRYRFIDEDDAGFALALQPHWERSWSRAAIRKGLAPEHEEFGLPIQIARHLGKSQLGFELGRNFIAAEPDEWQLGTYWSRACVAGLQCLAEVVVLKPDDGSSATLLNIGARYALGDHLVLMASLGRQVSGPEQGAGLFYLGAQLLR